MKDCVPFACFPDRTRSGSACSARRLNLLTAAMLLLFSATGSLRGDDSNVQQLRWNALLTDWQLLGPLPKENASSSGLDTEFFPNEGQLQTGAVGFYQNKLYIWSPADDAVIDFRKG